MCISPVRVRNSKHGFSPDRDRPYNIVQCNHCPECFTNKRNDIMIRALAESEYFYTRESRSKNLTLHKTVKAFFVTLTYDNNHKHECIFPDGKKRMVFSVRDIQLFFKNMSKRLDKLDCKYHKMVACEYGSDDWYKSDSGKWRKATHRPHYHILLFLDKNIDSYTLQRFCKECWSLHDWSKVKYPFGRIGDGTVTSTAAVRYVSKYVTKYDKSSRLFETWYNNSHEDELLQTFLHFYDRSCSTSSDLFDESVRCSDPTRLRSFVKALHAVNALKASLPFFHTSMLFGRGLEHCQQIRVNWDTLKVSYFDMDKNDFVQKSLPAYYKRKYYYEVEVNPLDSFTRRVKFKQPDDINSWHIIYLPQFESFSQMSKEYIDILGKNIDRVVSDTRNFYASIRSSMLSFKSNKDYQSHCNWSSDDWQFINDFHKFTPLSKYLIFNRGFELCVPDNDLDEMFRSRYIDHFPLYDFIDDNSFLEYEQFLQYCYDFNRIKGVLNNEKFKKKYQEQKLQKQYLLNL